MPKIAMYAQTCYIWSIYKNDIRIVVQLLPLCPTLWEPMDCSPPGFYGILQARILGWVAMPSSRGSSRPKEQTRVSYISALAGSFFTTSTT